MENTKESSGIHSSTKGTVDMYFKYYSKLWNQQNMMQDRVRTEHYQNAIMHNPNDFKDKVVMDVGAGSGILSIFAAKAGAKKVIAIEASNVAKAAQQLIEKNGCKDIIEVRQVCVEDIEDKELEKSVDVIVSEPLGTILFNERMLETYIIARDKFLKPGGKMFPAEAYLCIAPFYDEKLYGEQINKTAFWGATSFFGFDISVLKAKAIREKFRQPIIGIYNPETHLACEARHKVDFQTCSLKSLKNVDFDFSFKITKVGLIHGIGVWFDAYFYGSQTFIVLSTSPSSAPTHWFQMRFLIENPIAVNAEQTVVGNLTMKANNEQTFDIKLTLTLPELNILATGKYDMRDPEYQWGTYIPQSQS